MWEPSQKAKFSLDLAQGHILVPQEKIISLKSHLSVAVRNSSLTARSLASVMRKIISMSLALGLVSHLMTRIMYALLNTRLYWNQLLCLTPEAVAELQFWLDKITLVNGQEIWHSPSAVRVVYSDASDSGYGGFVVQHSCNIAQGIWSTDEMA